MRKSPKNTFLTQIHARKARRIHADFINEIICGYLRLICGNLRLRYFFRFFLVASIFFLPLTVVLAKTDDWRITKSTHFIVHYKNAQEEFLEHLIERAEDYYNKIADDLGFRRFDFWLWDNRAKIYIYDDAQEYQTATGQPSWSAGCALVREKIIKTFPYAQGFFDTILPHEMGHIIFREFVGFYNHAVPIWLDEGVACYQENLRRAMANRIVKEAMEKDSFIDLEKLSNFNPQSFLDSRLVSLFYAESLSIIDFLIKEFGSDNFVLFCQNLRDKKDLEAALRSAYPFSNIKELDKTWQRYLRQ